MTRTDMEAPHHDSPPDLLARAILDSEKRVAGGIWVYVLLWVAISFISGLYASHPWMAFGNAAIFLANALFRTWLRGRLGGIVERNLRLGSIVFMGSVLWNGLHWGLLTAAIIALPGTRALEAPAIFAAVGIAAAGSMALAALPALRRGFLFAVIGPLIVALVLHFTIDRALIAVMGVIFIAYMLKASKVAHADYWTAVSARVLLEERARTLEDMSNTDPLTKARNRRDFDRRLASEWHRAHIERRPLALLLVDLDRFKPINDTFGHAIGDDCLIATVDAIRNAMRGATDLVARFGGDELAVILPDTDEQGAGAIAQRVLQAVRDIELTCYGKRIPVTVSIGVFTATPTSALHAVQAVEAADKALYSAKHLGRDRIEFAR